VPAITTALEVYAALSDYIGDPGSAMALESGPPGRPGATGSEPTAVLGRGAVGDPEATQAGAPLFLDDDAVGWAPAGREEAGPPHAGDSSRAPAATPTRAQASDTSTGAFGTRSTGAGNGRVPTGWGPDAEQPGGPPWDTAEEPGEEGVPGRSWLRAGVVLATVLVVVVAAAVALTLDHRSADAGRSANGPSGSGTPSASPHATPVPISSVTDFDPQGNPPEENPDMVPLAHDGDPRTAWQTSTYYNDPHLGGLKSGVGLLVDLGKRADVGKVDLTLQGKPTSLQLLAAPKAHAAPTSAAGLSPVATAKDAGTHVDLVLKKPVATQWLVVWLTSLPPAPGGYQGKVAEISVRS
jgi:hypothetical protein